MDEWLKDNGYISAIIVGRSDEGFIVNKAIIYHLDNDFKKIVVCDISGRNDGKVEGD